MLTELLDRYHLCAFKESSSKSMQPNSLNGHTIEILPVFDPKSATEMLGSKEALIDILEMLITESKADLVSIDKAWRTKDYATVQSLAHKMKSSAIYCGTAQMKKACEELEHHFKLNKKNNPEELYKDFLKVCDDTLNYIRHWLHADDDI